MKMTNVYLLEKLTNIENKRLRLRDLDYINYNTN